MAGGGASKTPTATRGTIRSNATPAPGYLLQKPKEDLLAQAKSSTVNTPSDALKRLHTWKLTTEETPSLADLSYALLYTLSTQSNPSALLTDGIKAVALLLDNPNHINLPSHTSPNLTTPLAQSNTTESLEKVQTRVERIETTLSGVEQTMIELLSVFKAKNDNPLTHISPTPPNEATYTYAMAAKTNTPPPLHAAAVSRSHSLRKQILITKSDTNGNDPLQGLDEQQLTTKANVAFDLIPEDDRDPKPQNLKFLCVKRLRNGDVLMDLNTETAATWIRRSTNTTKFFAQFGAMTKIKDRNHNVLVELAPLTLDVDQPHQIAIAIGNNIPHDEIHQARWIKHKEKRKPNQYRGHLILSTKTAEGANILIDEGVLIGGRRLHARKLRKEPMRCHRCQAIGKHYARDCKLSRNVCGTCAGDHWTSACNIKNEHHFQCNNCRHEGKEYNGHAAWDIEKCPTMKNEQEKCNRKYPDNLYRFFITEDERTWAMINPDEPPYRLTPRQSNEDAETTPTDPPQDDTMDTGHRWLLSSSPQPTSNTNEQIEDNQNCPVNNRYSPSQPAHTSHHASSTSTSNAHNPPNRLPITRTPRPPSRPLIQTTLSFSTRPDFTSIPDHE